MNTANSRQTPEGKLYAWTLLACTLTWGVLAAPLFTGRVYTRDDLGQFHLPMRAFYAEQLARGESFDWLPTLYCGFYLTGEGQVGGYHPLHWLLYRFLPLGVAFDLELLLSYPFMLGGMYVVLRRHFRRRDAALFGGLVFTFSGFNLLHFVHPNAIAVVAHIPWLLWLLDVVCHSASKRQAAWAHAGIALATGSQLLLGYPQYVWFSLLAEITYLLWSMGRNGWAWRTLMHIGISTCIGMLIGAIQLIPTAAALADSTRQTADAGFSNFASLHPLNLMQLVAPYLFQTRVIGANTHELGLYAGAVPCLLAVWLLAQRSRWGELRPLVRAGFIFATVAVLLAFGEYGLLYRVQTWLPLVNRFRCPCRAIVLVHLALAVLAAAAMAIIAREGRSKPPVDRRSLRPLALCVGLSVVVAVIGATVWPLHTASWWLACAGPLLFAIAAVLINLAQSGARWALPLLVLFAAVDQGVYGFSYAVWGYTDELNHFASSGPRLPSEGNVRVLAGGGSTQQVGNQLLLAGLSRVDGYSGLIPAKRLDYRLPAVLQLAGVGWTLHGQAGNERWMPMEAPLPRLRLVTKIIHGTAPMETLDSLVGDFAQIEEAIDPPAGPPGRAQFIDDRPGKIDIQTTATTQQLLVLADSYHRGWQASIDGRPVPVLRVNGDFLGCLVPAGQHQVSFDFRPLSLRLGMLGSICGLGLMLCMFLAQQVRAAGRGVKRHSGRPQPVCAFAEAIL